MGANDDPIEGEPPRNEVPADILEELFRACRDDEKRDRDTLWTVLYADMHRRAESLMRGDRDSHALLQPTALVHEAFIRMTNQGTLAKATSRSHFVALAFRVMVQILADYRRAWNRQKSEGSRERVSFEDYYDQLIRRGIRRVLQSTGSRNCEEVHEALFWLAVNYPEQFACVWSHDFEGHTFHEIGEILGISKKTASARYHAALANLQLRIEEQRNESR